MTKKDVILSGIQATGAMHVGNYLGALKQFIDFQNDSSKDCYFFIADLHSLTVPFDPKTLHSNTLEVIAEYIAAGIDPERSTLFIQNQVPEHSELAWIFNCITPLGELERMTQFKDKGKAQKDSINAGLLTYPALMAADILLYKPSMVPVGEDQIQHLELARIIARKFNNKFGDTFPEPQSALRKPLRIRSLIHPERKMSKTNDEPLMISDSPEIIEKKLKKAVTASSGDGASTGVENLMQLLSFFAPESEVKKFQAAIDDESIKYSELKSSIATHISDQFAEFREKKTKLLSKPKQLEEIIAEGAKKAHATASKTMKEVKEKLGLV